MVYFYIYLIKNQIYMTKHSNTTIKRSIDHFLGADESFPLEHRFLNLISIIGGVVGILGAVINLFIDVELTLSLFTIVAAFGCWLTFYFSRFKRKFNFGRWVLTILLYILLFYVFLLNNGSRGPVLYLYMVFLLLLLIVWKGRFRIFFLALFTLNIIGFLLLEIYYPHATKAYNSEIDRLLDVYLSYILYIFLLSAIMVFAMNGYVKEKIKAQQSDQLKTAFLANMSHEIRTPMNAILGFAQLLENDISKEKKETYLRVIYDNGHSLLRLIEDIIDVSKIEAGELEIFEEEVNMNLLLSEVLLTFKQELSKYPEKSIKMRKIDPEDGLVVKTDAARLKQILTNLMHNAIKYTESGEITIGYSVEDEVMKFFVKDTGLGIRAEYLDEIFDRFRKIETDISKKIQPGTGIGLSISRHLAELLGGEMSVKSEFGIGSEFFFTIPYIPVRIDKQPKVELKHSERSKHMDFSGKTILIAEDENANFFFLKKVLERAGAEVIRARDGREAVDLFSVHPEIDIILMDILMPEMNGYQATAIIKEQKPSIPIIAQTALAMEGDAKKVIEAGCNDYLSKPIRMNDLLEKMSVYLFS